jgi:hypothetical protein
LLQVRLLEPAPVAHVPPRHHEHSVSSIVDGCRVARPRRHVSLNHLEHEQAVSTDQAPVDQLALEIRIALADEWRADFRCFDRRKLELLELVDLGAVGIPDADDSVHHIEGRDVDDAFLARTPGPCANRGS